jgi:hypothetical protein
MPEEYVDFLEKQTVSALAGAIRAMGPAEIAFGKTTVDLNVNRREIGRLSKVNDLKSPTGLVDNEVCVARIRSLEDGRVALLFNYTAHPLSMDPSGPVISADYPGYTSAYLQEKGAASHAQFLQGCAGNVNIKIHGEGTESSLVGQMLGDAVIRSLESAVVCEKPSLDCAFQIVRLPWVNVPKLAEVHKDLDKARREPESRVSVRMREWAEGAIRYLEREGAPRYAEVLVQALRIGDAVFVALPGEEFVEIGLQIKKKANLKRLFVAGYSNNVEIGYVVTKAAYDSGVGFEVTDSQHYFGLFQLSPECERIMVESALSAIRTVTY